jgi:hypothetical protein
MINLLPSQAMPTTAMVLSPQNERVTNAQPADCSGVNWEKINAMLQRNFGYSITITPPEKNDVSHLGTGRSNLLLRLV